MTSPKSWINEPGQEEARPSTLSRDHRRTTTTTRRVKRLGSLSFIRTGLPGEPTRKAIITKNGRPICTICSRGSLIWESSFNRIQLTLVARPSNISWATFRMTCRASKTQPMEPSSTTWRRKASLSIKTWRRSEEYSESCRTGEMNSRACWLRKEPRDPRRAKGDWRWQCLTGSANWPDCCRTPCSTATSAALWWSSPFRSPLSSTRRQKKLWSLARGLLLLFEGRSCFITKTQSAGQTHFVT